MNFKETLKLAESKGYKPILCHMAKYGGSAMLPRETTDKAEEISELALIQQFLVQEYKILEYKILVSSKLHNYSHPSNPTFSAEVRSIKGDDTFGHHLLSGFLHYSTPTEALNEGVFEALKLINEDVY